MRIVLDGPLPGQRNMDRDVELLQTCEEPTLRLYAWDRPTVSLGYAQRWHDATCPLPVVRRPTGGRALVHTPHEITYAVVWPQCSLPVAEAFAEITRQLRQALNRCGIPVEVSQARAGGYAGGPGGTRVAPPWIKWNGAACLNLVQRGELQLNGKKLVGSAQLRRADRLLQHGAIPLRVDLPLCRAALPDHPELLGLEQLGYTLTPQQLAQAWTA